MEAFLTKKKLEANKKIEVNKNDHIEIGGHRFKLLTQKELLESNEEFQLFRQRINRPYFTVGAIVFTVYFTIQYLQSSSKSIYLLSFIIVGALFLIILFLYFILAKLGKKIQISHIKEVILTQNRVFLIYHNNSIFISRNEITSITENFHSLTIHSKSDRYIINKFKIEHKNLSTFLNNTTCSKVKKQSHITLLKIPVLLLVYYIFLYDFTDLKRLSYIRISSTIIISLLSTYSFFNLDVLKPYFSSINIPKIKKILIIFPLLLGVYTYYDYQQIIFLTYHKDHYELCLKKNKRSCIITKKFIDKDILSAKLIKIAIPKVNLAICELNIKGLCEK